MAQKPSLTFPDVYFSFLTLQSAFCMRWLLLKNQTHILFFCFEIRVVPSWNEFFCVETLIRKIGSICKYESFSWSSSKSSYHCTSKLRWSLRGRNRKWNPLPGSLGARTARSVPLASWCLFKNTLPAAHTTAKGRKDTITVAADWSSTLSEAGRNSFFKTREWDSVQKNELGLDCRLNGRRGSEVRGLPRKTELSPAVLKRVARLDALSGIFHCILSVPPRKCHYGYVIERMNFWVDCFSLLIGAGQLTLG